MLLMSPSLGQLPCQGDNIHFSSINTGFLAVLRKITAQYLLKAGSSAQKLRREQVEGQPVIFLRADEE
jgi:hypothetical protein